MKNIHAKVISVGLIFFSLILFFVYPANASELRFNLTDFSTDIPYSIVTDDLNVIISSDTEYDSFVTETPITSCSVYRGIFTFLSYYNGTTEYFASYYTYDINNKTLKNTLTNLPVYAKETRFSVDTQGRFYLVDRYNESVVNCYFNGEIIRSADVNATIHQIMCIDGTHINVVTANGVYLIDDTGVTLVSEVSPVAPCSYIGNKNISDKSGALFTYENGVVQPVIPETTLPKADIQPDVSEETEIHLIRDNYILTQQGVTVAKLRKSLSASKENFCVYKKDGSVYTQGKVGTGMTVVVSEKTYIIIIYGELTGEGNINSRDLKLMMKFLTGEISPDEIQKVSADINCDTTISTKDLLALSKLY